MFNASSGMPYLEAELAYRRDRLLSEVEGRRAVRALRPRGPRRPRTRSASTRRSQIAAAAR